MATPAFSKRHTSTAVVYVMLTAAALLILVPFLLSFLTSFKTARQFAGTAPTSLPSPPSTESYSQLLGSGSFGRAILVTVAVAATIVIAQVTFSIMAAYAFARLHFPGRDVLFWVYLSTMMVPAIVTLIPLYAIFSQTGLRNTFWSLVLPTMFGSPYAIFLLRQHFLRIPEDLLAAARLDGAGHLRTLWHIVIPVSRPIIATLVVITVVTHWNNFLWPLIITSGERWQVITVATANLQSQYNGNWTLVMAATTVAIVPLVALFIAFHKHIVDSLAIRGFN
ncbi:sugar ABC transporter permease [Rhodococcus sp. 06-235-1A]|uniref:carbohydrate ABC transporter permease n=1 Tax=Rhodococcus sp. 06-235-1A TaxID=2022508 RepID=UPI000B9C452F|nr:carbohydrate ABC transporter permease [Rhodococcus sp. 06-235-1A]OZC97251.1 sugar ABC transporter permease [Rhodococcus sp. 06-235-1A]